MKALIVFLTLCLSLSLATTNLNINLDDPNPNGRWLTFQGTPSPSYFGRTMRNIGDFNGDGIDDMVIAAPNVIYTDTLYVIYGQKDGFLKDSIFVNSTYSEGFFIKGFMNKAMLGCSVSKAVDLNGDGLCDIVFGAYAKNIVYVIYGKKGQTGDIIINSDFTFSSQGFAIFGPDSSNFGNSVSSAGDFNGDGLDDILIGAPNYQNGMGAAYVIYGRKEALRNLFLNESFTPDQGVTILNLAYPGKMGASADGVGDINGDGIDDILLGAPETFSGQGIVYALYGQKNPEEGFIFMDPSMDSKGFMIYGSQLAPTKFGSTVSSVGDINGDGVEDMIIGGFLPTSGPLYFTNKVYVFYGQKENWASFNVDDNSALQQGFQIIDSRSVINLLGITVSGGGDLNGDGFDDIFVRAKNVTGGGYVAVIYGSPIVWSGYFDISTNLTLDTGFIVSGSDLSIGSVLNSVNAGDLNNDHIDDLFIGSPQAIRTSGKAYVVFGSNGCPRNCSSCQSSKCLTCFEGYGYGLYNSACGTCPSETYLSQGKCEECPDDCIKCKSSSKCQICAEGYTMSDSQTCISEGKEAQAAISSGLFDGASAISNTLAIGSSVPTSFGLAAKILRNTKYLNISVSKDLQATFNSWKITTGIFTAPDSGNSESQGELPLMFERYGIKKAFLVNYWKSFTMILLGLGIFIISKGAEIAFPKNNSISKITRSVNMAASNFVLTQFYGSIDDILFYFVLDIRSNEETSSSFRTFGFILGFIFLVAGIIVTEFHGAMLWKYQKIKKKQGGENKQTDFLMQFLKRYENMKLFYQDFKDVDVFQQAFLLINITRSLLSSFIFTMLFHYPLLQILLLIALNISILVYLYMKKPFKDKANAYAQYYCEGILSFAYLSILILAFKDEAESEASGGLKGLSMIVIFCNMMLLIGSAVFMFVNIGGILYKMYQERKVSAAKKKGSIAIHSRFESHNKIDENKSDITIENSLNNNERSEYNLSNSGLVKENYPKVENLIDSSIVPSDPFQTDVSPASFTKRRTLKVKYQRNAQSTMTKPSLTENHPESSLQRTPDFSPFMNLQQENAGDSSLLWLNSQSNFLLNPVEIKGESITTQNNDIVLETFQDEAKIETTVNKSPLEYWNEEDIQELDVSKFVDQKKGGNVNRRKIKKNKNIGSDK